MVGFLLGVAAFEGTSAIVAWLSGAACGMWYVMSEVDKQDDVP